MTTMRDEDDKDDHAEGMRMVMMRTMRVVPGAYSSTIAHTLSANASLKSGSDQEPTQGSTSYGAYCTNSWTMCLPVRDGEGTGAVTVMICVITVIVVIDIVIFIIITIVTAIVIFYHYCCHYR